MKIKKNMPRSSKSMPAAKDPRSVLIPGKALKIYLDKQGLTQAQLAKLLGVNAASLSRWGRPDDAAPTSTTFLVLLPLLLGSEVDLIPSYYSDVVSKEFVAAFGESEAKKHRERLKTMAKKRFFDTNPDVLRARRLFEALSDAWRRIDALVK